MKLDCADLMKKHIKETISNHDTREEEKVELNFLFEEKENKEDNFLYENEQLFNEDELIKINNLKYSSKEENFEKKFGEDNKKIPVEIKSFTDLNLNLENFIQENQKNSNNKNEMDINDLIQSHKNKKEKFNKKNNTKNNSKKDRISKENDRVFYTYINYYMINFVKNLFNFNLAVQ